MQPKFNEIYEYKDICFKKGDKVIVRGSGEECGNTVIFSLVDKDETKILAENEKFLLSQPTFNALFAKKEK